MSKKLSNYLFLITIKSNLFAVDVMKFIFAISQAEYVDKDQCYLQTDVMIPHTVDRHRKHQTPCTSTLNAKHQTSF